MGTKRFVVGMLLATTIVAGDAFPASSHTKPPPSPPDSYVTDWDAVGTQAFSTGRAVAGRRAPDLCLCLHRRVRRGDGCRRRVRAVRRPSRRARGSVRAGSRGGRRPPCPEPLPTGSTGHGRRPCVRRVAGDAPRRPGPRRRCRDRRAGRPAPDLPAGRRRLPGHGAAVRAPRPARGRCVAADGADAADRQVPAVS